MKLPQTPSQTIGPFFAYGLVAEQYGYPHSQIASGSVDEPLHSIRITGQVFDGGATPVADALVEIWDSSSGFARQGTGSGAESAFKFSVPKPRGGSAVEAPHFAVVLFMRGLLSHLYTRIYFDDEAGSNSRDAVLSALSPEQRRTLTAKRISDGEYRFDIHLQGEHETVFFDV